MSETAAQRARRDEENRRRRASGLGELDPMDFISQFGTMADPPSASIQDCASPGESSSSSCTSSD